MRKFSREFNAKQPPREKNSLPIRKNSMAEECYTLVTPVTPLKIG
jgi:hypothetical protein